MIDFYQPGPHYTLLFLWCSCSTNVTFCSRRSHQVTWREENIGWKMGWSMEKTFDLENKVKIRWQDGAKFNICHGKDTGSEIRKAGLGRCLSHLPAMGGGGGLVAKLCLTLWDPMDCSLPGSSVHGISQARILGVGCHFLLGGIFPTQGSNPCILLGRQIVYHQATLEALLAMEHHLTIWNHTSIHEDTTPLCCAPLCRLRWDSSEVFTELLHISLFRLWNWKAVFASVQHSTSQRIYWQWCGPTDTSHSSVGSVHTPYRLVSRALDFLFFSF